MDATIGVEPPRARKLLESSSVDILFQTARGLGSTDRAFGRSEGVLSSRSKSGGTHRETVDVSVSYVCRKRVRL